MHELGSKLYRKFRSVMGQNASANTIAGFEKRDLQAHETQITRSGEAGNSSTNDQHVWLSVHKLAVVRLGFSDVGRGIG